jgi:hypothetical protein
MEKVFYLEPHDGLSTVLATLNDFLSESGRIVSVTSNKVGSHDDKTYGGFLVVVDDGYTWSSAKKKTDEKNNT